MVEKEGYRIMSHKFIGYNDYGNGRGSYTYELSFNKSMEHTGKHSGIEKGLDDYDKEEIKKEFRDSFKYVWNTLLKRIKLLVS